MPKILFIGGMDSSGGAGLLRDTATATAFGVTANVAVTAVTAQSDSAVAAVLPMPPSLVRQQIDTSTAPAPDAIKIGMLANAGVTGAVITALPDVPVVLDPVIRSSSGMPLLDDDGLELLLSGLLPRTTLLTPNLPELLALRVAIGLTHDATKDSCCEALLARGCKAVLLKGGHGIARDHCEDRLYLQDGSRVTFTGPRWPIELRGTGCQLASGIAANMALGKGITGAVQASRDLLGQRFAKAGARASGCGADETR